MSSGNREDTPAHVLPFDPGALLSDAALSCRSSEEDAALGRLSMDGLCLVPCFLISISILIHASKLLNSIVEGWLTSTFAVFAASDA